MYLAHDANGDACRALVTKELTFDLLPLENVFEQAYPNSDAFFVNVHEPTGEQGAFQHIEPESPLYEP